MKTDKTKKKTNADDYVDKVRKAKLLEPLISKKELCKRLMVSPSFIYNLRGEGLPHIQIASAVRFRYSDVIEFLENHNK